MRTCFFLLFAALISVQEVRSQDTGMILPAADTIIELSPATGRGSLMDGQSPLQGAHSSQVHQGGVPEWKKPFPYGSFILPAAMITYGVIAIKSGTLRDINEDIKKKVWDDNPHSKVSIDNYLQFAPALAVYGLNAAGIHGKNNFKDRTIIYLMANVFLNGTVQIVKHTSHELRPDGSDYYSFPSGHSAEAFASAEFMRMEYKDVSPWFGIAGYAMAAATGYLRMYNNKHWMSDVVAGAGVGIASTRLAYWLYPKMQHWFGGGKPVGSQDRAVIVMPTYSAGTVGLVLVKRF